MERLSPDALRKVQAEILATPRMAYGLLARVLFVTMDLCYGRRRSLEKFKVLEIVARVPYQAWEQVAYVAITHTYRTPDFARRIHDRVHETRRAQDNEQWHLFIIEELLQRRGVPQGFFWYWLVPQLLAFAYYHVSWLLYVIRPGHSYRLNAEFEDHAEHEYMEFIRELPELASEPWESVFAEDYGQFATLADLFRQIGFDEHVHKEESLARLDAPRFS
ncbi:MAG TPA: alternative oxidase [Methylomirabilota bacterium]|jgi:hypothetical protein|nr:alternative oxidase [Methylomirabilota bacterium]